MRTDRHEVPFQVLRIKNAWIRICSNLATKTNERYETHKNVLVTSCSAWMCLGQSKHFFTLFHATATQNNTDYTLCSYSESWGIDCYEIKWRWIKVSNLKMTEPFWYTFLILPGKVYYDSFVWSTSQLFNQ